MRDPFDLAGLRVDPTTISRQSRKWRRQYVQFPWAWVERLKVGQSRQYVRFGAGAGL